MSWSSSRSEIGIGICGQYHGISVNPDVWTTPHTMIASDLSVFVDDVCGTLDGACVPMENHIYGALANTIEYPVSEYCKYSAYDFV